MAQDDENAREEEAILPYPWREGLEAGLSRGRGLLTNTDREWLVGLKRYASKQQRYDRRSGVTNRLKEGILDLVYLPMLKGRARERLLEELGEVPESHIDEALGGLVRMLYWFSDGEVHRLEDRLETAVFLGLDGIEKDLVDVDLSIDPEYGRNLISIRHRLQAGHYESLTPSEIGVLVKHGEIDLEDLAELDDTAEEAYPDKYQPFHVVNHEELDEDEKDDR